MVNHPNRRKAPYVVHLTGSNVARFTDDQDAQEFAQVYSERHRQFTEVSSPSGLIGQYKNGCPTPEFAARGDAWYPAGPRF